MEMHSFGCRVQFRSAKPAGGWPFLLATIPLIVACSTQPVRLDTAFSGTRHMEADSGCDFVVIDVSDDRMNRESLGRLGLSIVTSDDVILWLKNGLSSFIHSLDVNSMPSENARPSIEIRISLRKAHIVSMASSMASNIVIGVSYPHLGEKSKYFRGSDTSMNWATEAEEVKISFDRSLQMVLTKIRDDAETICRNLLTGRSFSDGGSEIP